MKGLKLSMSVDLLPAWPGSRPELLEARICLSNVKGGDHVTLLSDPDLTFDSNNVAAALRAFADRIERKYAELKEVA